MKLPFLLRWSTVKGFARHPQSMLWHIQWTMNAKRFMRERRDIIKHFDNQFYLETYPELRNMVFGPARHYILRGWKEGRDPSELFSTADYLNMYGDVAVAKINPFRHWLKNGRDEGRVATVSRARRSALSQPRDPLVVPPVPAAGDWDRLPARLIDPPTAHGVNVVIPVYKSLKHVAATIRSVLEAQNETPCECLVIDDCSPEPEVSAFLKMLADKGLIRLLVNEANLGFVGTVNRGMAHNEHRDVVLLNADTFVHHGWLDRLMRPLRDDPHVATVTPLSNNATIASYPLTVVDNFYELEVDSATLDRLAFEANGHTIVDVPTGVGFCMAIRRTALDRLGLFDAETFGLGYGEECDFCMRAIKDGWRNVFATGIYVRHFGSASFGPSQASRSSKAQELLAQKHPDYAGRVARHVSADPLLPSRILFDIARLREFLGPISIVFFTHTRGGGIETYLRNTLMALIAAGMKDVADRAVVVQTQVQGFVKISAFNERPLPYLPNLEELNIERHNSLLDRILEVLDPQLIHMNTFAGLSAESIGQLMAALKRCEKPYWHVWHDHQPVCPRLTFLDAEDRYCGETDASRCVSCLASTSTSFEWVRIEDWRASFRDYLAGAEVVSAPSEAAALRARRLADVSKVKVHPHPEPDLDDVRPLARPNRGDGLLRICVLGAIGPHKGAYLLHAMIRDIEHRKLPIHIDVVGYTALKEIQTGPNVTVHGRYAGEADAIRRIRELQPDVALISSIWPETYVFTLSVPMALHLPTAALDLGAQGERVAQYSRGIVLDAHLREDPLALNDALLAIDLDAVWSPEVPHRHANQSPVADWFRARAPELLPPPQPPRGRTAAAPGPESDERSAHPIRAIL
ncbi:glycosyltransferase [Acuticoccus sp. I52.16.1]|uniref:glycosyltransferase family 2 protein n=1 Tax=Acuticoccus sp. I52.16.1 TaxID=2928472 RepID=UPI001FD5031D|nr:glycosyltransferase [Acuticoccus sp. I52.16.1]UOM34653.1 glycosyltransferase [Acuticoccus sp. I52.16.1]